MEKIIKSINSVKAAMMMVAVVAMSMFTACSSDGDSSMGGPSTATTTNTTDTQKQESATTKAPAKVTMTWEYEFGDSLLNYCDAKVVYTNEKGEEQQEVIEQSKCKRVKELIRELDRYEFKHDITTFPSQGTVRVELTPKTDLAKNATTGATMTTSRRLILTSYDASGSLIKESVYLMSEGRVNIKASLKMMHEYFEQTLNASAKFSHISSTYKYSVNSQGAMQVDEMQ